MTLRPTPLLTRALACAALLAGLAGMPAGASAGVNARQAHQRARIHAGVRDGSLTRPEARHLRQRERHIARLEHRFRRSGGGLGPHERRVLRRGQDRTSRAIWRQRHDGQVRR